jgi:hypothetical protein
VVEGQSGENLGQLQLRKSGHRIRNHPEDNIDASVLKIRIAPEALEAPFRANLVSEIKAEAIHQRLDLILGDDLAQAALEIIITKGGHINRV